MSRFRVASDGNDNLVESGSGMRSVKLTRVGGGFTPYHSLDGVTWMAGPRFQIDMPAGVLAGLAIFNGDGGDPAKSPLLDSAGIGGPAAIELSHRFGSLGAGQSVALTARVTGVDDPSVTWSLSPETGSITASGLYQAPEDAAEAPRTVTIVASGNADPNVQARTVFKVGAFEPVLINAGGEANRTEVAVEGMQLAELYRTARSSREPLEYRFTVPNGDYTVRLRFIETEATQAGQRRFDVCINGQTAVERLDIFAAASGAGKPLVRQFAARVEDGELRISFLPVTGDATVNAIEVQE